MMMQRLGLSMAMLSLLSVPTASAQQLRDIIGVAHIGSGYNVPYSYGGPTYRDQLNEGADQILALGSRVIKVQLFPIHEVYYPFTYPGVGHNIVGIDPTQRITVQAQTPVMQTFFGKGFSTVILNVGSNVPIYDGSGNEQHGRFSLMDSVLDGLTTAEAAKEKAAIKNLARYLLNQYRGSGKTFVIANGEADLLMRQDLAYGVEASDTRIQAMIDWINARQAAVTEARAEIGASGVQVVYSCEVQYVHHAGAKTRTPAGTLKAAVDYVIPSTNCDLYDYTTWDIGQTQDPDKVVASLNYLEGKAKPSALYGERNIYIGEFGFSENTDAQGDVLLMEEKVRRVTEAALGWGVRYLVYWQLQCNQRSTPITTAPVYQLDPSYDTGRKWVEFDGLWLIRPDGTKPRVYTYLQTMLTRNVTYAALRAYAGGHVSADQEGGGAIYVNAPHSKTWEAITILDLNGGTLQSGDVVSIVSHDGHWFMAWDNGGREVVATATRVSTWEKFNIFKLNGAGTIVAGDQIALRAGSGQYFVAANGGAVKAVYTDPLNATSASAGSWETFTVVGR